MKPSSATPNERIFVTEHHEREVRKHWDYLTHKYANAAFRGDTSQEVANVTNDAINLARGFLRYGYQAPRSEIAGSNPPAGMVWVDEQSFRIIMSVLTHEQMREVCLKEGERLFKNAKIGAMLNEDGSVTPARDAALSATPVLMKNALEEANRLGLEQRDDKPGEEIAVLRNHFLRAGFSIQKSREKADELMRELRSARSSVAANKDEPSELVKRISAYSYADADAVAKLEREAAEWKRKFYGEAVDRAPRSATAEFETWFKAEFTYGDGTAEPPHDDSFKDMLRGAWDAGAASRPAISTLASADVDVGQQPWSGSICSCGKSTLNGPVSCATKDCPMAKLGGYVSHKGSKT